MDCVTCILVGMCVMCGPGIGRSDRGANAPGRPMTEAEVDQALSGFISQFRPTTRRPPVTYNRRQSFIPDYRFSDIGIGKRKNDEMTLQSPFSIEENVRVPESSKKEMTQLLRTAILRQLLKSKRDVLKENDGDSIGKYGQIQEDFSERLKNVPSRSNVETVNTIMNTLKRVSLEEQLLKKIAQGNKIAIALKKLRTKDRSGFNANKVNS